MTNKPSYAEAQMTTFRQFEKDRQELENRMRERGNQLFTDDFLNRKFPAERLSDNWRLCTATTIRMCTHRSVRIGVEDHTRLCSLDPFDPAGWDLTFVDFAALSNSLEHVGPGLLPVKIDSYWKLVQEIDSHIAFYADELGKARAAAQAQVEAEFEAEQRELAKRDPGRQHNPLKPVAEA